MKNLSEYITEATWKSSHNTFNVKHLNALVKDWKITVIKAMKALDNYDYAIGGPAEWNKDEKFIFVNPETKVKYKYDFDGDEWEEVK